MPTESVFDVNWEGPYSPDDLSEVTDNCVLYMISGTHGLYGRNVPLYLGKTTQSLTARIKQHQYHWLHEEPDAVQIYAGYAAKFVSWEVNHAPDSEYDRLSGEWVDAIESLLIFSHQPVYNARAKKAAVQDMGGIRIFNTGKRATLLPEVSSLFWIGPASKTKEILEE